ncbi:MAG: hypothetical protein AB7I30_10335 [Isosphaeraceae bacterium]
MPADIHLEVLEEAEVGNVVEPPLVRGADRLLDGGQANRVIIRFLMGLFQAGQESIVGVVLAEVDLPVLVHVLRVGIEWGVVFLKLVLVENEIVVLGRAVDLAEMCELDTLVVGESRLGAQESGQVPLANRDRFLRAFDSFESERLTGGQARDGFHDLRFDELIFLTFFEGLVPSLKPVRGGHRVVKGWLSPIVPG